MKFFLTMMRSKRHLGDTAVYQVQRLGYKPENVKHIIQMHLHLDHAGGLADFPHAQVHVLKTGHDHGLSNKSGEYHPEHWAHEPNWVLHKLNREKWYDFDAIQLEGFEPEMWLVPLTGHTPGHMAVAIKQDSTWVMHGGDAVLFDMKVDDVNEWITKKMLGPHLPRIREFMKAHPEVKIVGSHMSPGFYEKI
jgi:glyoxylase-like metal-dependent hydrolase (beta-lactamase superfamily II)